MELQVDHFDKLHKLKSLWVFDDASLITLKFKKNQCLALNKTELINKLISSNHTNSVYNQPFM